MPLSASQTPRKPLHTRRIELHGYEREDGMFDVEAHMTDTKAEPLLMEDRGTIEPGEPLHGMALRMTVDRSMTIVAFEAVTDYSPYSICPDIAPNYASLVGLPIRAGFLRAAAEDGVAPAEIGLFVRSRAELPRAHAAAEAAGLPWADFTDRSAATAGKAGIGVMHLAKGLEFKAVVVMACDADVLPLKARMDAVIDEADLDDVFETERQLFYVACTRARDRLLITGTRPASDYLADLS